MTLADLSAVDWGLLLVAAACVGFAKTAISGVAAISVVIFAAVLPARESTGALLALLLCGDLMALRHYHRHADWPALIRLLPAVLPGLALGAVFVAYADDRLMRVSIGVILLVMTGLQLWSRRGKAEPSEESAAPEEPDTAASTARRRGAAAGAGLAAGFTTMTANTGGPVMTLYLVMSGLPMLRMLGTAAWFFFVVNVAKVPFSVGLGLISWQSLAMDALLIPAMIAGGLVGLAVIRRIDQRQFERAALALSGLGAALLLVP